MGLKKRWTTFPAFLFFLGGDVGGNNFNGGKTHFLPKKNKNPNILAPVASIKTSLHFLGDKTKKKSY